MTGLNTWCSARRGSFLLETGESSILEVPVVTYLVSGWDLTSIYTYQPQGAPLSWGDVIYKGPTGSLNDLKVNPHAGERRIR